VTACQDGSVYLWHAKKSKPVFKLPRAHLKGWISALDTIKQSNIFATGGIDRVVKIWGIEGDNAGLKCLHQIGVNGIVTDLKLTP
jgi:WD40 repeat protein